MKPDRDVAGRRQARRHSPGTQGEAPEARIAKDFGIAESCLHRWLHLADVEDGVRPGTTGTESAEPRDLRKRNRVLVEENEILRRATAFFARDAPQKGVYPLIGVLVADEIPVAVTCRVLDSPPRRSTRVDARPDQSTGLGRRRTDAAWA